MISYAQFLINRYVTRPTTRSQFFLNGVPNFDDLPEMVRKSWPKLQDYGEAIRAEGTQGRIATNRAFCTVGENEWVAKYFQSLFVSI